MSLLPWGLRQPTAEPGEYLFRTGPVYYEASAVIITLIILGRMLEAGRREDF